jgi:hypothetical protein
MCAGNSAYHRSISLHNYRKTLRVRAVQVWPQDLSINPEICEMFLFEMRHPKIEDGVQFYNPERANVSKSSLRRCGDAPAAAFNREEFRVGYTLGLRALDEQSIRV